MLAAILVAALLILITAAPALGHAAFVESRPQPGEELGAAPGVVVIRFSEPLNVALSRATVTDPAGQRFVGDVVERGEIRIPLSTNALGVYEVDWTTVSPIDGHTLRGRFRFGVGVAPGEGAEGETAFPPGPADILVALSRWVEYVALFLALGIVLLQGLGRRQPDLPWVRPRLQPALGLALAAGLGVIAGEALLAAPSPSMSAAVTYLTTGLPGLARIGRLLIVGFALFLALLRARSVGVWIVGAMVALAAAGHAAAVRPAWWGITVDAAHLVSAGLWAGGILALLMVHPPGGWRGPEARGLLDRFSPVAIPAFLVTVGAGILRGVQELSGLQDVVSTSYGRVLGVKALAVIAIVPLSLMAWRRVSGSLRLEGTLAVFVIGAAALLAAYPLPPGRLGEAEEGRQTATETMSALPRDGDLTLGGDAGEVLVGLTLRPGEPGRNRVLVYLLPLNGPDAASPLSAELRVGEKSLEMQRCGPTCRRADVDLQGGEEIEVKVGGRGGGTASFEVPEELPAPDGARVWEQANRRMHQLRSYRLDEVLSSGRAVIEATYEFQAPDRMRSKIGGRSSVVWIDDTRYRRDRDSGEWEVMKGGPPAKVPSFNWDFYSVVASPRLINEGPLNGTDTAVISLFVGREGLPIWFRMWIDRDGLVHRAEMRAQGHFMDHTLYDFDAPISIEAP